ncbi:TPA: RNA-binding protein [Streptococcus agalactiae]|nr:RNA-binding protein [Streptococcus agalactiae]HEO6774097.1 RNA-binding protein [Streptococcus agalactiae]
MKSGQKIIELRLYDERRQTITIGDYIVFYLLNDKRKKLTTEVACLHIFDDFSQLYESLDLLKCGYTLDDIETARPEEMERYYPPEQIRKYGALGIELRLLHG